MIPISDEERKIFKEISTIKYSTPLRSTALWTVIYITSSKFMDLLNKMKSGDDIRCGQSAEFLPNENIYKLTSEETLIRDINSIVFKPLPCGRNAYFQLRYKPPPWNKAPITTWTIFIKWEKFRDTSIL